MAVEMNLGMGNSLGEQAAHRVHQHAEQAAAEMDQRVAEAHNARQRWASQN